MIHDTSLERLDLLKKRFALLYGTESADACTQRLKKLIDRHELPPRPSSTEPRWDQRDAILITYGDMLRRESEPPLRTLRNFLHDRVKQAVSAVHILPFFPWSSDDGFSVIDYRRIDPALGDWPDVQALGEDYKIMFDLVLNHVSRHSHWFQQYLKGVEPYTNYFIERPPDCDISAVVRPRSLPLLTPFNTSRGVRHVWTTFSDDQIDLNFANPDVLFEFLDIILTFVERGMRLMRLDAIAYLWKEEGGACIHLAQTHEVVKLIRDVLEIAAPQVLIITETNVPHDENISYFGNGDEAHMVYQFSLPPLLLDALLTGTARHLTKWAAELADPPEGCTFFNFTASHDGIGVRPLEGLVPPEEIVFLGEEVLKKGGRISTRRRSDGSDSPYELNITYYSALADADDPTNETSIERFLCSQAIMLAFRGVPGIYFHSLTGTLNDLKGMEETGRARSINRRKWQEAELNALLDDPDSHHHKVFSRYLQLLNIRQAHPAFHPDGAQRVLDLTEGVFSLLRTSPDGKQTILALHNVSPQIVHLTLDDPDTADFARSGPCRDLINGDTFDLTRHAVQLAPYQTRWLKIGDRH